MLFKYNFDLIFNFFFFFKDSDDGWEEAGGETIAAENTKDPDSETVSPPKEESKVYSVPVEVF